MNKGHWDCRTWTGRQGRCVCILLGALLVSTYPGFSETSRDALPESRLVEMPQVPQGAPRVRSAPVIPYPPPVRPRDFDNYQIPDLSLSASFAVCGDGVYDPGEECDDANRSSRDGCSETCRLENPEFCGDGEAGAGETCDDGNRKDGDGCSATCQIETYTPLLLIPDKDGNIPVLGPDGRPLPLDENGNPVVTDEKNPEEELKDNEPEIEKEIDPETALPRKYDLGPQDDPWSEDEDECVEQILPGRCEASVPGCECSCQWKVVECSGIVKESYAFGSPRLSGGQFVDSQTGFVRNCQGGGALGQDAAEIASMAPVSVNMTCQQS